MAYNKKVKRSVNPSDIVSSKLLLLLVLSFVYIFILMFIYNNVVDTRTILTGFFWIRVMFYVSIGTLAAAVVFLIIRKVKKTDESLKIITCANVFRTAVVFFIASAMIYKYDVAGIKMMYVVVPAWFVLYLIYTSFVKEFFFISVSCAIGCAVLYFLENVAAFYNAYTITPGSTAYFMSILNSYYVVLAIVLVILGALVLFMISNAQKNAGSFKLGDKHIISIASNSARWPFMYACIAILMAVVLISIFYKPVLIYGLYAVGAYFACMAVYYTYKLLNK